GVLPSNLERIAITGPHTVFVSAPFRMTAAGCVVAGLVLGIVFAAGYAMVSRGARRWVLCLLVVAPIAVSVPAAVGFARNPGGVGAAMHASYSHELASAIATEDNPYRLVNLSEFAHFLGNAGLEKLARDRLKLM